MMTQTQKWRIAMGGLVLLGLSGCAGGAQSAWQLVQAQQAEQAQQAQWRAEQETAMAADAAREPGMLRTLIQQNYQQQRYFAALAYLDDYRRRFGDIGDMAALQADALMQTGQREASAKVYRSLLETPQRAQGLHGLGLLAGGEDQYAQAEAYFREAAALAPTQATLLNDLAYARMQIGDDAGARVPLGQALELGQGDPTVIANMALLLMLERRDADAQRLMQQAALPEAAQAATWTQAAAMLHAREQAAAVPPAVAAPPLGTAMVTVVPVRAAASSSATSAGGLQRLADRFR